MQLSRTHDFKIDEEIVLPGLDSALSTPEDQRAMALTALTRLADINDLKIWSLEGETDFRHRVVLPNTEWSRGTLELRKVIYRPKGFIRILKLS
jgi:hypothetical protein